MPASARGLPGLPRWWTRACACCCARPDCPRSTSVTTSSVERAKGATMGQYDRHVFVCTSGDSCPVPGDTEKFVKTLRAGAQKANLQSAVRINKAGCFSQCGHGPMMVVYPENVWYAGVKQSDLEEILTSHIIGGRPVERLLYSPGKPGPNKIDVGPKDTKAADQPAAPDPSWK